MMLFKSIATDSAGKIIHIYIYYQRQSFYLMHNVCDDDNDDSVVRCISTRPPHKVIVVVQNLQIGRLLVEDDNGRTLVLIVVVAALPVLFAGPPAVAKEPDAVNHQQLTAVLLGRNVLDGVSMIVLLFACGFCWRRDIGREYRVLSLVWGSIY